jgi:hypothetical protein
MAQTAASYALGRLGFRLSRRALCALWLWLLGRATFAGAPEVTGTRAEAGEEEKGLSSLRSKSWDSRCVTWLPRCYHSTLHEANKPASAAMADPQFLACLDRPDAAQLANRPGS